MIMKSVVAGLTVCIAVVGAGLASAAPASAEPPNGSYTATVTEAPPIIGTMVGETSTATFTPCGQDCIHLQLGNRDSFQSDLHLQGTVWTGTRVTPDGQEVCTFSLDTNSMVLTDVCPIFGGALRRSLTKNG
jgi:hypothetical protein